jgi:sec-independent protein translocase protein TatC
VSEDSHKDPQPQLPGPDSQESLEGDQEARMTFTEHLGELRDRIIRSGICLIVTFFLCYAISDYLFEFIAGALSPQELKEVTGDENATVVTWYTGHPLEGFVVKVRVAGFGALLLSFPFIVWQLCAFVFPGLHSNERRAVQSLLVGCGFLGILGFSVAYFFVFPTVLPYLLQWNPPGVNPSLRLGETITIIVKALVGFSIAFQFPMGVMIFVYMGVLTPEMLKEYRKMALIGMAVLSAMFTPPEPVSMLVMLCPLYLLYELSILASHIVIRKKEQQELQ